MLKDIIDKLIAERKPYRAVHSFSDKPGIYALFFMGDEFPLEGCQPNEGEIIYIGKTETSQKSRDRDTHFATGKTGSSTLRRSFGAMLRQKFSLTAIPRGQADIAKRRLTKFKFDDASEVKLTQWMQNKLGLSYFEFDRAPVEIDCLETDLIRELVPVLNIDRKNPNNLWKPKIQALRKETGILAYDGKTSSRPKAEPEPKSPPKTNPKVQPKNTLNIMSEIDTTNVHKYEHIWQQLVPKIREALTTEKPLEVNLGRTPFDKVGNRKSYSFRLELNNGLPVNNIGGSAVARDLARVLEHNALFMDVAKGKQTVLRLDSKFTFTVQ